MFFLAGELVMKKHNITAGIGFRRCGTSYLHSLFNQIDNISKLQSGSHLFSSWNFKKEDALSLLSSNNGTDDRNKSYLDFSVSYGYPEVADITAKRLADFFPTAKVFCIIRNPVDRLISDIRRSLLIGEVQEKMGVYDFLKHNPVFFRRGLYSNVIEIYESHGFNVEIFKLEDIYTSRKHTLSSLVAMILPDGKLSSQDIKLIDRFAKNTTTKQKLNLTSLSTDRIRQKIISISSEVYRRNFYRMHKELSDESFLVNLKKELEKYYQNEINIHYREHFKNE
jgi:hypothetical protein